MGSYEQDHDSDHYTHDLMWDASEPCCVDLQEIFWLEVCGSQKQFLGRVRCLELYSRSSSSEQIRVLAKPCKISLHLEILTHRWGGLDIRSECAADADVEVLQDLLTFAGAL